MRLPERQRHWPAHHLALVAGGFAGAGALLPRRPRPAGARVRLTGTPAATRSSTRRATRSGSPGSTGTGSRPPTRSRTDCGRRTTTRSSTTSRAWATTPSGSRSPTRWWRTRSSRRTSASITHRPDQHRPQGPQLAADPRQDHHLRGPGRPQGHPGRSPLRGRGVGRGQRPVVHQHVHQPGLGERLGHAGQTVRGQPHRGRLRPAQRAAHPGRRHLCPGRHLGHRRHQHRRPAGLRAGRERDPGRRPGRADLLRGHQREPDLLGGTNSTGGAGTWPRRPVPGHAQLAGPRGLLRARLRARTCSSRPGSTPRPPRPAWTRCGTPTGATCTAQGTAPVWVGEFGTDNTAADVSSSAAGSQGQWFASLVVLPDRATRGWAGPTGR